MLFWNHLWFWSRFLPTIILVLRFFNTHVHMHAHTCTQTRCAVFICAHVNWQLLQPITTKTHQKDRGSFRHGLDRNWNQANNIRAEPDSWHNIIHTHTYTLLEHSFNKQMNSGEETVYSSTMLCCACMCVVCADTRLISVIDPQTNKLSPLCHDICHCSGGPPPHLPNSPCFIHADQGCIQFEASRSDEAEQDDCPRTLFRPLTDNDNLNAPPH